MSRGIMLLALFCYQSMTGTNLLLAQGNPVSQPIGKVTFIKGKVTAGSEANLTPGQAVYDNEIVETGSESKVKLLLNENKVLVTILSSVRARITTKGAELLAGSSSNIDVKKMDLLRKAPDLDIRSKQLGGTFAMRGAEQQIRLLDLKDTFIREKRPTFRWSSSKQGSFLISLNQIADNGEKIKLWENQTSRDSLPFPADKPSLEEGKSYYWEINDLSSNRNDGISSGQFYILSAKEKAAVDRELALLAESLGRDEGDEVTSSLLKIELLKKYNLNDDVKGIIEDLQGKFPENEEFKKML